MTTGLLSAELSATCNALGYNDGAKYYTDPYVKETVKDLIRYLRRDDDDHQIRRHLGNAKVLQTDLIPILMHHSHKEDLFDVVLRLVVNLTNPALLVYHEEIPVDKTARNHYLQIISHLQSYKEAFIEQKVWDVLAKKLGDLLQIEYHERDEDVGRTMERILILSRNVLNVPVDPDLEKRPDNDASIHDQVLWALHQAGMVDMFLYIASTENEQQFYLHVLEIITLMLREQKPDTLASSAVQRSVEEKEKDETELLALRQAEIMQKQQKIKKYAGSRHSRFGGTFVLKNVKSISDNDVIYHKTLDKVSNLTFDSEKKKVKTPKNLLAMQYQSAERKSAFSIRLFLKEFCVEFMNGAYNPMMRRVKENLVRATGQPNDESYYFWAMKFFMEFNRKYKFEVKLISETMSRQTFHFVQTQLETWHEMMVTDKKKIPLWSRRMHLAVKAYQELLHTLMAMDKSPDPTVRESSRVIKSNVFYVPEYRELIIMLFNLYSELKFSKEYLKDLVQTAHIFLKMLEHYSSRHRNLMVQTNKRSRPKKKKTAKKSAVAVNLESIWEQVGPELSVVLQSQDAIPTDVVPFDAASDLDMDQQKVIAMKRIQTELKQGNFEEAVGLLRASREVWPENDCFGNSNMQADEEFLAMREIFLADIGQPDTSTNSANAESEDDEENEEDEQAANIAAHEQNFNFFDFAKRFASPKVVAALCQLLARFDKNSDDINHCVAKLLHRIVWDCKCPAMLFQATVFRTFQRLMASTNPAHKELMKLSKYVVHKFYEVSLINRKVFVEMLFWKSSKEAYEIEFGYGVEKTHSSKNMWTEEQEDELRRLCAEYERDQPEPDCVEWIMKNLIKQDRSKRSVIKKLKEMYLYMGNKNKSKSSRPPREFTEEEEEELRTLFDEYKNALDPMACIMGKLTVHRPKNKIIDKLLAMGLVEDRKQLFKKRQKRNKYSPDNSDSDLDSDKDSDSSAMPVQRKNKPKMKNKTLSRKRQVSSGQIAATLRKVMDAGLKEALIWLQSCLKEVEEDLDDAEDNEEGTALLPLSESSMYAMDNPIFLQLLDILDIHKPTDQEIYWRIPSNWKAEELNKRMTVIENAVEGRLQATVEVEIEEATSQTFLELPSQTKKKKRTKKTKPFDKKEMLRDSSVTEESRTSKLHESGSESSDSTVDKPVPKKSKRIISDSSTDDDDNISTQQRKPLKASVNAVSESINDDHQLNHSTENISKKIKRRRAFVHSSSEDDKNEDNSSDHENNSTIANSEKNELNSSSNKKNVKRRKSFKYSSGEDEMSTEKVSSDVSGKKIKQRQRVESSSEDEDFGSKKSISVENNEMTCKRDSYNSDQDISTHKSSTNDSKLEDTIEMSHNSEDQLKKKKLRRAFVESSSEEEDFISNKNTSFVSNEDTVRNSSTSDEEIHTSTQKSSIDDSKLEDTTMETSCDGEDQHRKKKKQKTAMDESNSEDEEIINKKNTSFVSNEDTTKNSSDSDEDIRTSTQKSSTDDSKLEDTAIDESNSEDEEIINKKNTSFVSNEDTTKNSSDSDEYIRTSTQKSSIIESNSEDEEVRNKKNTSFVNNEYTSRRDSYSSDEENCTLSQKFSVHATKLTETSLDGEDQRKEKKGKIATVQSSSDEESSIYTITQNFGLNVSDNNKFVHNSTFGDESVSSLRNEISEDRKKKRNFVVDSSSDDDSKPGQDNERKKIRIISDDSD